jgi:hypothetical protein
VSDKNEDLDKPNKTMILLSRKKERSSSTTRSKSPHKKPKFDEEKLTNQSSNEKPLIIINKGSLINTSTNTTIVPIDASDKKDKSNIPVNNTQDNRVFNKNKLFSNAMQKITSSYLRDVTVKKDTLTEKKINFSNKQV